MDIEELKKNFYEAGESSLDLHQMAALYQIPIDELVLASYKNPELGAEYQKGKMKWQQRSLQIIQEISMDGDPENKQRLRAAIYLFELYSNAGQKNKPQGVPLAAHMTIEAENNMKLIDDLGPETVEAIKND